VEVDMRKIFLTIALLVLCVTLSFLQAQGVVYRLHINNIDMPLNRRGVIADVNIPTGGSGGKFKDNVFLFSAGFFLSGFSNGQLWTNAVASATLVQDYVAGQVDGQGNPKMYVLNSHDPVFGYSWQDWSSAVNLGADFYDGDDDGTYNPVDKNGNGVWDTNEDRPDLIGDETVWCVYHDGAAGSRWNTVEPQGIEIRQTVFAFGSAGAIGNLIFLRYRIKYVGLGNPGEPDKMTDVYFGVWADPDMGQYDNDVVGSDVPRNAGYTYDNQTDYIWGEQPPCFMIDFFSGPRAYIEGETFVDNNSNEKYDEGIDTPLDTAFSVRGQVMGVEEFPGAKNMPISSFVLYVNGDPNLNDPSNKEEARNYMLGLEKLGTVPDPCTFPYGAVLGGIDCTTIDPRFWFSGDPVTNVGWIATINEDVRQMINTGPFELIKGEENEIVVAYVVGQGVNPLDGLTVARQIDDIAQNIFDLNFDTTTVDVDYELSGNIPAEFHLEQNYPNPFNPTTTIKFLLPSSGYTILKIYNTSGEVLAMLLDNELNRGVYEVEWNATGLPSGVYYYQLRTEGYVENKKMILIK
jgi:hypothetical protein